MNKNFNVSTISFFRSLFMRTNIVNVFFFFTISVFLMTPLINYLMQPNIVLGLINSEIYFEEENDLP